MLLRKTLNSTANEKHWLSPLIRSFCISDTEELTYQAYLGTQGLPEPSKFPINTHTYIHTSRYLKDLQYIFPATYLVGILAISRYLAM